MAATLIPLAALLAMNTPDLAAKDRNWESGTLLDSRERSYTNSNVTTERGTVPGVVDGGTYSRQKETHEVDTIWQEYMIKAGAFGYRAKQPLQWRWSKPAVVTVGGPVKFAVEGRSLYLVDDSGKEYKMELLQRVAIPKKSEVTSGTKNNRVDAEVAIASPAPAAQSVEAEVVTVKAAPPSPSVPPKGITVHFTSTPSNAEIDVDGNYWGSTPTADLTRLPAGTHTITVKKLGYKPWERKIELAQGDDRTVNAELEIDPAKPRIAGIELTD
jgi:hypothetical protein